METGDYADIIARLEAATWPDRELDCDVAIATKWKPLGPIKHWVNEWGPGLRKGEKEGFVYLVDHPRPEYANYEVPDVTASLDAALALVEAKLPSLTIHLSGMPHLKEAERRWMAQFETEEWKCVSEEHAPTAPLAVLIALFRALQAQANST